MSRETFEHLRGVADLAAAYRAVGKGDLGRAAAICEAMEPTLGQSPGYRKLLATVLFHAGRAEEANAELERYLDARPEDFDALLLAYRIMHIRNQRSGPGRIAALPERLTSQLVQTLERLGVQHGGDWARVCADVVTDDRMPGALRANLINVLFGLLLTGAGKAAVGRWLLDDHPEWSSRTRLFAAGVLLLFAGQVTAAMDRLLALSAAGSLAASDYASIVYAFNLRVGSGDAVAHAARHGFLQQIYRHWMIRLAEALAEHHPQPPARPRPAPSRRVAILTSPLVNLFHGSTNRVLEIAASLHRDHGYEVRIFEGGALHYRTDVPLPIIDFFNCNHASMVRDSIGHGGIEFAKWRSFLDDSQPLKFLEVAAAIETFEPDAVIAVGDASPVQGLLAGRIPVVLFPTNSSPPVGPADRYVCLWSREVLGRRVAAGEWPAEVAAKCVFGAAGVRFPKPTKWLARGDVVPGADLVLAIVGPRLAAEIRGEFAARLADFLAARPGLHLLCVGDDNPGRVLGAELAGLAGRVHCRGFERELANLMTGCDVFLNPPRQGGGTSVAIAMAARCAVVATDAGDGATLLDQGDLATGLDDYFERLAGLVGRPADLPAIGERMAARVDEVLGIEPCMQVLAETLETVVREHGRTLPGAGEDAGPIAPGVAAPGRRGPSRAGGRSAAGSAPSA